MVTKLTRNNSREFAKESSTDHNIHKRTHSKDSDADSRQNGSPQLTARRKKGKKQKKLFPHSFGNRTSLIDNVLVKLKNRPAFDILSSDDTQGLVNLGGLVIIAGMLQLIATNYINHGFLVDYKFLLCLLSDTLPAMVIWTAMTLFSFSSYFLELSQLNETINSSNSFIIHMICLAAIILVPTRLIFLWNLAPVVSAMLSMNSLILAMKMHSYYATNTLHKRKSEISSKTEPHDDSDSYSDEETIIYPQNVTIGDYIYYLCAPSLVYEKEYPRTPRIRYIYALKELVQMFGCFLMAYIAFAQFILPIIKEDKYMLFYDLLRLAIPSMFVWLIGFYGFFHCFLNGTSALLRFADRQFYLDWWNSENLEEFWKKWNLLVHEWMLRHVYYESIRIGQSKMRATLITFFLSAVMHEVVLYVTFKVARPWFFLGMFIQVPLIIISKLFIKILPKESSRRWGNVFVWCSLFFGQPIIEILYIREWFWSHSDFFCVQSGFTFVTLPDSLTFNITN